MKKAIKSFEEFKTYTKLFKSQNKNYFTNFYLMPKTIQQLIEEERLFIIQQEFSLFFLVDEMNFYHTYFYHKNEKLFENLSLEKPCLIEIVYTSENENDIEKYIFTELLKAGAQFHKKSVYVATKDISKIQIPNYVLPNSKYQITFASLNDSTQILTLWKKYLDLYDFNYFNVNDINNLVTNQQILVIKSETNYICACSCIDLRGKQSLESHIVVDPMYRGIGFGKILMYKWIELCQLNNVQVGNAWIDQKNSISLNCHLKIADITNKISAQYILKKGE